MTKRKEESIFCSGCPKKTPDSFDTCEGSMTCTYGEECCCGECHHSLVANCDPINKKWIMYYTDACLGADSLCSSTGKSFRCLVALTFF